MQLDKGERGFSFLKEGPLDMRMDRSTSPSACYVVNTYSERRLGAVFREYGEERDWRRIARALAEARSGKRIETTGQLVDIVSSVKRGRRGKLHPATQVFRALRMLVNRELDAIRKGVGQAIRMVTSGGRIGTLAFHSLEDRIVKTLFREASRPIKKIVGTGEEVIVARLKNITKSPIVPSFLEKRKNPGARSAKLRVAEKL
ncbi:MAG: 16S rRNA (cytosine(1402)-N(4))-methyltransferase RsmH [Simkaniaceae bacterium]|nr:16S rRNA (cytosine(1402)-N(4))-methyltransferase RsmH [Simkaniaceae bacterium]